MRAYEIPLSPPGRAMRGLLLGIFLAIALVGCGKKGPPEAPEGSPSTFPRAYPRG